MSTQNKTSARVGCGRLVRRIRYQGRLVSAVWYHRHVDPRGITQEREKILAVIHLPAIAACRMPQENRLIDLADRLDRRWARDIADCYALPPATELTTFFPALVSSPNGGDEARRQTNQSP